MSVCLSVCAACDVDVFWPNGWMDQDVSWYRGRHRPRPHCVRWGPVQLPNGTGHSSPPLSRFTDAGMGRDLYRRRLRLQAAARMYCGETIAHLSYC